MADNFFGFGVDMPTHEVGNGSLVNDLGEAAEEDEIDMLNDETFGNCEELDGDWEEEHERLAEKLESCGAGLEDRCPPSLQELEPEQKFHMPQRDLEQSLNQLVVDDDDVYEGGVTLAQPIPNPRRDVNLDELFGPSSPPGFLSTENLVSPDHKNIWGSPARDTHTPRQEEGIKNLLQMLQKPKPMPTFQDPSIVIAGKTLSTSLQNAHSVDQLEKNLGVGPARAVTVEELENEMRGGGNGGSSQARVVSTQGRRSSSPFDPNLPLPIGTPPSVSHIHSQFAHAQNHHGTPVSMVTPPGLHQRISPPTASNGSPLANVGNRVSGTPGPPGQHSDKLPPFLANTPVHQRMPPVMPFSDPTHLRHPPPRGTHTQGMYRPDIFNYNHNRGRYSGSPNNPHFGRGGRGSGEMRGMGDLRGGGDMRRGGRGGNFHQNYRHQNHHQQHYGNGDYHDHHHTSDNEQRDEYANLMTQREKDWIIKIQLMQLHTDNPYIDDYYYTTWDMKKRMEERQRALRHSGSMEDDPKIVLPQLAKVENRSYKPVQFEGSLGRLTASSVHNPRKIIDVCADAPHSEEDAKVKEVRRFKQLLVEIEQGYDILLDIDDMEKRALALPEETRPQVFQERRENISKLFGQLQCNSNTGDKFNQICSVRKGLSLVARILLLLAKNQAKELVSAVLRNISIFSRKDLHESAERMYQAVSQVVFSSSLETLVEWSMVLQQSNTEIQEETNALSAGLQGKFGASVIWCFVSRGEAIFRTESPVDLDVAHQNAWQQFINWLCNVVNSLDEDRLAVPYKLYPRVPQHMEKILDKRSFVTIEEKLNKISQTKDAKIH